jgi:DNA replication protein DnaC
LLPRARLKRTRTARRWSKAKNGEGQVVLLLGEAGIGKSRYERRSMLITANQPFGDWGKVFPDQAMTLAAIDRCGIAHRRRGAERLADERHHRPLRQAPAQAREMLPRGRWHPLF